MPDRGDRRKGSGTALVAEIASAAQQIIQAVAVLVRMLATNGVMVRDTHSLHRVRVITCAQDAHGEPLRGQPQHHEEQHEETERVSHGAIISDAWKGWKGADAICQDASRASVYRKPMHPASSDAHLQALGLQALLEILLFDSRTLSRPAHQPPAWLPLGVRTSQACQRHLAP